MKLFAIFGDPVAHSRSPLMHNMVFKNLSYKACYTRVHLQDGSKLRETFFSLGLFGANITVPHKEAAFMACDEVHGFAKKVGVVNTIIKEDNKLIGYNTDADGFIFSIAEFGTINNVLIIGAGGTAKALAQRFIEENMTVSVLNRSAANLLYFQNLGLTCHTWESFDAKEYNLVVNTTSAGLRDESLPAPKEIIEKLLESKPFVADAIYGKLTPFLQEANKRGCRFKDGADMLLGQGVLANELFTDSCFTKDSILQEMQKSFLL